MHNIESKIGRSISGRTPNIIRKQRVQSDEGDENLEYYVLQDSLCCFLASSDLFLCGGVHVVF